MAAPQVKIEKAGLYKMISYKGTSGAAKKYTPMTAAKRLGEIENSMTVGMASVVSGINSLGSVLNSISANSAAMVSSLKASVSEQIKDNQELIKREKQLKKEKDARDKQAARERKKADEKAKRDAAEKGAEAPLFKKIRETFAQSTKKAFSGIWGALVKFATFFLKFFVMYKALDWIANNPGKIEKLAKGLFALGKFVFRVTTFLVGSGLDGFTKFMENPLSLKGFFGAIQFVASAAPLFIGLAFLKSPVNTVKALAWVVMSLGKGIMNMHKQGKLMNKLKAFKSTRMARLVGSLGAATMAFTGAQLDGASMAESLGAGGGAAVGQMAGAKLGDMLGNATGIPGLGMVGGALGGMVGAPVGKAIGCMIEPLVAPVQRFIGQVSDTFNAVIGAIKEPMTEFFQGMADVFNTLLDIVEPYLPQIAKWVGGGLKMVLSPFLFVLQTLTKVLKFFAPKDKSGDQGGMAEATQRAMGGPVVVPSPIPQMAGGGEMTAGPIKLVATSLKRVGEMGKGIGEVMLLPFKAIGIGIISAIGMVGRMFGKFLPAPLKSLLGNALAPIANAFGVPLSLLGADVGGGAGRDKAEQEKKESEFNFKVELLKVFVGEDGIVGNFTKMVDVLAAMNLMNKGIAGASGVKNMITSGFDKVKSFFGFAKGGWINGPMSGYPVSLDGGRSTSFIGHGTEWVGYKQYAAGGAYVVPFNTPATKKNGGLTSLRMRQAAAGGYALPFSEGGHFKPTLKMFSEGGMLKDDEAKTYRSGQKHTNHFKIGETEYGASYTRTANDFIIKSLQRVDDKGGWFGWGQKKPHLSPSGSEFQKVLKSPELAYALAKHAGLKSGGNRRGHGKKVDPSLISSIIADPKAAQFFQWKTTPKEERKKLEAEAEARQKPIDDLEKTLMEFGAKMGELKTGAMSGEVLDEAQLKENAELTRKQEEIASTAGTVITEEVNTKPTIVGDGGGDSEVVIPTENRLDADPYLMPKFGLVPEFTTDVANMM